MFLVFLVCVCFGVVGVLKIPKKEKNTQEKKKEAGCSGAKHTPKTVVCERTFL
jgi:hypothetical protein